MKDRIEHLLNRLFHKRAADETQLRKQVQVEHERLNKSRARAQRVLDDFHRAEVVIRGEYRG